jgi:Plant transposon protein
LHYIGVRGASTDQKITAALRQLSLGVGADAVVEYVRLSESTISECLKRFCAGVVSEFKREYLRNPNTDELRRIENEYAALGFPGCAGCVDCASWEWDCCPTAWQGNYKGKDRKPTCRLEVICDDYLYIWHVCFGSPGSKNDISIMNNSDLFNAIRVGKWPPCRPDFAIAGKRVNWFYYLADGIYPRFKIFVCTIPSPKNLKEKVFSKHQESVRKSVERVFGVLFQRFHILHRPSRLWYKDNMALVVNACCIIHNMIVSSRRSKYTGTQKMRLPEHETRFPTEIRRMVSPSDRFKQVSNWREHIDTIEDPAEHESLKQALASHIWEARGGDCLSFQESDGDEFME